MKEYRILVCGGRYFNNKDTLYQVLDNVVSLVPNYTPIIINGGASGADTLSCFYASDRNIPYEVYVADWETHGRSAGPIRNKEMLTSGNPDVIIAFEGGRGTADMIQQGKKAGVTVYEVK